MITEKELTPLAKALARVLVKVRTPSTPSSQSPGRELPSYNYTLGGFLNLPKELPQTYTDVLTQIYPLPADIRKLTRFCEKFLNQAPDQWTFEPAAPWVVMQVCNYGKIATLSENVGWVSQHEFAFGFPVAWYEVGQYGQRKFIDWAMVYPYIWVDDPLSMSMGRQVYGWAKAGIELKSSRPNLEPNTRCLVSIDLKGGPERSFMDNQTKPRFLEILQHQPILSGRSGVATLNSLPARAMGAYLSAASGMLGTFNSMLAGYERRLSGYVDGDEPLQGLIGESVNLARQTQRWTDNLEVFLSNGQNLALAQERILGMPVGSKGIEAILRSTDGKIRIITQKQFRDAADPEDACFSAIVGSTLKYSQPIDGGTFLSDPLSPDSSGGILIYLRDDDDLDIVGGLGLRCLARADDAQWKVHTLRPEMPFWVKLDASYKSADCQCWRTRYTDWSTDYTPDPTPDGSGSPERKPKRSNPPIKKDPTNLPYLPWGSGAPQEVPPPLKSANFGLWIYGLKADGDKLQELCDNYLQPKDGQRFYEFTVSKPPTTMVPDPDPSAFYVLMIVSSFDALSGSGKAREFKDLHDRVLTFAIPATYTHNDEKNGKVKARGGAKVKGKAEAKPIPVLIPLYTFVEQDWDFLTEYEVYGRFAFKSLLESPPYSWVEQSKNKRELLTVHTTIFPEKGSKPQRARFKPLIQIWEPSVPEQTNKLKLLNNRLKLTKDLTDMYLQWLGLKQPVGQQPQLFPIRSVSLKQVRDAIETDCACYQALVGVTRNILEGFDMDGDPRSLEVRFYKYPGMAISDKMGIECNEKTDDQERANTIPGASIAGEMYDEKAQGLCWTIEKGKGKWQKDPSAAPFFP